MGSDHTVTQAARISFDKSTETLTERDIKLINYLAKEGHLSCFEHCLMTVEIKCPLLISQQIQRHRTFAFNQLSRRYTSENIEFYDPKIWMQQAKDNRQASDGVLSSEIMDRIDTVYGNHLADCLLRYDHLLELGVSREQARMILPQSTYTRFIMTGNLRNWHHFISLRAHKGAQEEAQIIARKVQQLLTMHFPVSMTALSAVAKVD
jgi:thymidylate synthase (FAD)